MFDIPGKPALCACLFFKRNREKVDLKERGGGGKDWEESEEGKLWFRCNVLEKNESLKKRKNFAFPNSFRYTERNLCDISVSALASPQGASSL